MGIDVARFCEDIDGDLICPICSFVLEDPIQAPICEHAFCNSCITEWLKRNQTCPIDRTSLSIDALKPAPRIMRNLLSRLNLTCTYRTHGCPTILTMEKLAAHLLECNFDPKRLITCQPGCGFSIPFEELVNHNCVQRLKIEMESMVIIQKGNEEKISKLQSELDSLKANQRVNQGMVLTDSRWLTKFKTSTNSDSRLPFCLQPASWMLTEARKLLYDSGCPLEMVNALIDKSNKSRWPHGIRSADARKRNHNRIKDYICRYEDGHFCWSLLTNWQPRFIFMYIIMASDNTHMDQEFVINPGFLLFDSD